MISLSPLCTNLLKGLKKSSRLSLLLGPILVLLALITI